MAETENGAWEPELPEPTEQELPEQEPLEPESPEKVIPDADTSVPQTKPKRRGVVKKAAALIAVLILLIFAFLKINEVFGINDKLPAWDDLYYTFGLRTRAYTGSEPGTVSVHFIDVGQGDCALIRTGNRDILIDCGEYDEYANVAQYLKGQGISRLDTVIMSHPHSDHMGCMFRVVRRFGADALYMPELPEYLEPVTGSYTKLTEYAREKGIPMLPARPGVTADTGGNGSLTFLAPVKEYEDLNNFSDVVKFTYGEVSFLFCGDIESEAEGDILASGADIAANVIKVPHHGSGTSSTRLLVQAVRPEYAVFCVGEENDYGHPHDNIVRLYRNLGAELYRTDMDGDIVFVTDGRYIDVYTGRAPAEQDAAA